MNTSRVEKTLLGLWCALVVAFVTLPLFAVLAVSLTPRDFISLPVDEISLRWYRQIATRSEFLRAAGNSLMLAFAASASALVLGTLAAIGAVRFRSSVSEAIRLAITSPLFIPMILTGLAILVFTAAQGLSSQGGRLFIAHLTLTLPYVFRTVIASLTAFDMNQEYAARNLGATPLQAFFEITLPQIRPGLVAGAVFAFIVSFDDVSLSIFLTGNKFNTLPVELFNYTMNDSDPMAAAIAVLMMGASIAAILIIQRVLGLKNLLR